MPYPTGSQPRIRPAADFPGVNFARSCRHAKHERSFDGRSTSREKPPDVSVVLAYDNYADGIRAKEFFDGLVFNHGELFHFICHLWKFDVLREPQLFETARRDALGADMIVFAIRQSQELPVEARRWIAHWLPSKQAGSGALVLLLDGQPRQVRDTTTVRATLKQMAESVKVQVFWKETVWPAVDSHLTVQITNPTSGGTAELINSLVKRSPTQSLTKV